MFKTLLYAFAALLFLSGCSNKEYYKPDRVAGNWTLVDTVSSSIIDRSYDGALLKDGHLLRKNGISKMILPEGFGYISNSDGWIITSNIDGDLVLMREDTPMQQERFELKKTVATASVRDDILAVLFANNEKALYSIEHKTLLYKEQGSAPSAVDVRIAKPYFLNELVLFSTLDGKIDIVNSDSKKLLRSMIVSSEEHFNNVIYFNVIDNTLFAATGYRIMSLGDREMRQDYELRDAVFDNEGIWLSTKQGEVVALTPSLQLKAKRKFPFAHFLGMIVTDSRIFLLEKEGYMIVLDKTLNHEDVFAVDLSDGFVFVADDAFYVDDERIAITP